MCGIAGIIGAGSAAAVSTLVEQMVGTLVRRGPDGEGIECWNQAVLGHRRLAIFDLTEAGKQPMVLPDRSVGVVFNGAIYNYRELRKELEGCGHRFRSQTDTEVLLHGYRQWGLEILVSRLRGMFAFGLWDETRQTLHLVRDRLGVKPLVIAFRGTAVAFASTTEALRASGFVSELDETAIAEYLRLGFVPDSHAIYSGVVKLPAGSILEWSDGRTKTSTYWTPTAQSFSLNTSFDEAVEQAEHLLLNAVESRLDADVPVGVLLSSGIDSALVCWAVSALGRNLTAFTIATPGDVWDESSGATATAQALGINHQIVEITSGGTDQLLELSSAYSEPFACASALGMLNVARAVSPTAKVLLTGDGGDDVFLGYPRHRHMLIAQTIAGMIPNSCGAIWWKHRPVAVPISFLRRGASLMDYATQGFRPVPHCEAQMRYSQQHVLGERLSRFAHELPPKARRSGAALNSLVDLLNYEQQTYFTGEYMTKVDGACMHYGLEGRSPFLDHHLWEFAMSLPFEVRLHHWHLKAVLRELARRKIGRAVAYRKKRGFGIPVQRWLVGRWRTLAEELLEDSLLAKNGFVNRSWAIEELALSVKHGIAHLALWYVVVLELWLRTHNYTEKPVS